MIQQSNVQRKSALLLAVALLLSPLALKSSKAQEPAPLPQTPTTQAPAATPGMMAPATPAVAPAAAQSVAPATPPKRVYPAPTNLQVLPKTLTGQQVHDLMEQWEQETGMHCGTCHANDPVKVGPNGRPVKNFPDDSKIEKRSARLMYLMTQDINGKYLAQSKEFGDHVDCGTCHRGHQHPQAFKPEPEEPHAPGAPVAPEHDHDHDHDHAAAPATAPAAAK